MEFVKAIHVTSAYVTGLGFLLRGVLAILQSSALKHRLIKILPHIVDTFLLVSGLVMMVTWSLWPTSNLWLLAKLIALICYIGFGLIMLRWGNSAQNRWIGLLGGLSVYCYIVGVAHTKSIMSLLILI